MVEGEDNSIFLSSLTNHWNLIINYKISIINYI